MKLKFAHTNFKIYASLWEDMLQFQKQSHGKEKFKKWDRKVDKLKGKFLHVDYP